MGMTDSIAIPVSEPVAKILHGGLDLRFSFSNKAIIQGKDITARVQVRPTSDFAESFDAQDRLTGRMLLGEGLVASCELEPRDRDDYSVEDPEPEDVVAFAHFRDSLLRFLERRKWLKGGGILFHGNGGCTLTLQTEIDGHDVRIRVRVDRDPMG